MKIISRILIFAILHLCWFSSFGYAETITTESSLQFQTDTQTDRQRLLDLLDRQEVIGELEKYGISKVEATVRINSLTDEEVIEIAGKLDELPAGGNWLKIILSGIFFVPVVLIDFCICFIPMMVFRMDCFPYLTRIIFPGGGKTSAPSIKYKADCDSEKESCDYCTSGCASQYVACANRFDNRIQEHQSDNLDRESFILQCNKEWSVCLENCKGSVEENSE